MRFFLFSLLGIGCNAAKVDSAASAAPAPWSVQAGQLRDGEGRQRLLHGVNARVEGLFDVTFDDGRTALEVIPPFSGEDCAFISEELGMNLLRLPVNWSGIEPQPGQWDEAYLAQLGQLVDDCAAADVWTIVDLHQDAYGKDIGEDGAPLWAITPPPTELLEGPLTAEELARRRLSVEVLQAFNSLYTNAPLPHGQGALDAYAAMAAHLAAFLSAHPGAIALELHNEPVTGGRQDLLDDFHDAVAAAIRAERPDWPLVFEPDSLRNLVDSAPVERPWSWGNGIYGPHIYTDVFEDGWASEDTLAIEQSVADAATEASAHAAHLFIGEFGHDPRTDRGALFIETSLHAFDTHRASWAIWLYEEHSQDAWGLWDEGAEAHTRGALREAAANQLARPFPTAIEGELLSLHYDRESRVLAVTLTPTGDGIHTFAVPTRTYPLGVRAECSTTPATTEVIRPGRISVQCSDTEVTLFPADESENRR